jgi:hypothetical protein
VSLSCLSAIAQLADEKVPHRKRELVRGGCAMVRWIGVITFATAVVLLARPSQSDIASTPAPSSTAASEPITGSPAQTAPGSETIAKDPFQPFSIGPPEAAVPYEVLTPPEQAVADKGRDIGNFALVNDAFAHASAERAATAAVEAAQHQLGIDNLASTGVTP